VASREMAFGVAMRAKTRAGGLSGVAADLFSVRLSSACSVLSPSLLTFLHHFIHVLRWPNLENVAVLQGRMLRHELYSMIHVPRLKDENAAELFLGFRIGTVRSRDFAVLPIQGQGGFRILKSFSTRPGSLYPERKCIKADDPTI
jgi:hypothetical protein